MPRTNPWNSVKEPHHHDNTRCGPGSEIPTHNRMALAGNRCARTAPSWTAKGNSFLARGNPQTRSDGLTSSMLYKRRSSPFHNPLSKGCRAVPIAPRMALS
jgi:hypothetical protein